jgi:membrane fusion protein, adhesin transport system
MNPLQTAQVMSESSAFQRIVGRVLAAGLLALMLLFLAPWQQTSEGMGRMVALSPLERPQEIDAPLEGRITEWKVREGSKVKSGETLLVLSDNDPNIMEKLRAERKAVLDRIDHAKKRVTSIADRQISLDRAGTSAVEAAAKRIAMARQRTRANEELVGAARAVVDTAKLNYERQKQLLDQGLSSNRTYELAQLDWVRSETELERATAAMQGSLGEEGALTADRIKALNDMNAGIEDAQAAEALARVEIANAEGELARIDVRLARQATMEVKATTDGTVLRLLGGAGTNFVKSGDPLLVLVPEVSSSAVEMWVDGNDVPLIQPGRNVRLQFEGWPAVQFSGWPQVAVGTFAGIVTLVDSTDDGKGKFRIVVGALPDQPWPSSNSLRQGVRVHGWILLDQVRFGYELWRRLNGFPMAISSPAMADISKPDSAKKDK